MKKMISLGVVSTMVASMSSVASFATTTTSSSYSMNKLNAYVLNDDSTRTAGLKNAIVKEKNVNGINFTGNVIYLEGSNTETKTIVFGASTTCIFGNKHNNPAAQEIIQSANSKPIKSAKEGSFKSNSGSLVQLKTNNLTVNVGAGIGDYTKACGLVVNFNNTSSSDRYAAYTLTLTDSDKKQGTYTLVTKAFAFDKDDTSKISGDVNEDTGAIDYNDGAPINNGECISVPTLKEGLNKKCAFYGKNGVNVLATISKATVDEGRTLFNTTLTLDSSLNSRYNADGTGKVMRLQVPFFHLENREINIDCENSSVINLLGTELADRIIDGLVKKMYVYPINEAGYNSLARASGNDGLINTAEVITANIKGSKVVFTLPKEVTDVMISLKEIDTTTLPAIPGVSVSEDVTSAANEITAPIVATDESTSNINIASATTPITPEVVSAPVLTEKPAATNAGTQNTGVARGMVACACAAIVAMAAAVVTTVSKKSFKRF